MIDMISGHDGYQKRISNGYHKFRFTAELHIFHPVDRHICTENDRPQSPVDAAAGKYLCHEKKRCQSHLNNDCTSARLL